MHVRTRDFTTFVIALPTPFNYNYKNPIKVYHNPFEKSTRFDYFRQFAQMFFVVLKNKFFIFYFFLYSDTIL